MVEGVVMMGGHGWVQAANCAIVTPCNIRKNYLYIREKSGNFNYCSNLVSTVISLYNM